MISDRLFDRLAAEETEEDVRRMRNLMQDEMEDETTSDPVSIFADLEPHAQWDITLDRLRNLKPEYTVHIKVLLEKKIFWARRWGSYPDGGFSIEDFEVALLERLEELSPYEIVRKAVGIKSSRLNSSRHWQTLDELTSIEWQQTAELTIHDLWDQTLKPVDVLLELNVEQNVQPSQSNQPQRNEPQRNVSTDLRSKRSRDCIDSSDVDDEIAPQKPPRKTRTNQSLSQLNHQIDRREQAGNFADAICKHWTCVDENCRNFKEFCWVAPDRKHYSISAVDQQAWSISIIQDEANIRNPPAALIARWMAAAGPVNRDYKRPLTNPQTSMQQCVDMQKQMEWNMMERTQDSLDRMQNHQDQKNQRQQWQWQQQQPQQTWQYSLPAIVAHPQSQQPWQNNPLPAVAVPRPFLPPPSHPSIYSLPSRPSPQSSKAAGKRPIPIERSSSPIAAENKDEGETIMEFFDWLSSRTPRDDIKEKLTLFRNHVYEEVWSWKELKSAAAEDTRRHLEGLNIGVPGGVLRGLNRDMDLFKTLHREKENAARQLASLAQKR